MDFVNFAQAWSALRGLGVEEAENTSDALRLALSDVPGVTVVDVAASDHPRVASLPGEIPRLSRLRIASTIEMLIHKLRVNEIMVIPVGSWRHLFEAVGITMAQHETWRAVDSTVTVELNTRDPLLFLPTELRTLRDLVQAVLSEGRQDCHGIGITTTGRALVIEVMPVGEVTFHCGNRLIAEQVLECLAAASRP